MVLAEINPKIPIPHTKVFDWWYMKGVMCMCDCKVLIESQPNPALKRLDSQPCGTNFGAEFRLQQSRGGHPPSQLQRLLYGTLTMIGTHLLKFQSVF